MEIDIYIKNIENTAPKPTQPASDFNTGSDVVSSTDRLCKDVETGEPEKA